MFNKKKRMLLCIFFTLSIIMTSCGGKEEKKKKDVDFTVCDESRIPDELKEIIDEKKKDVFKISYANNSYFYIAIGYGKVEQSDLRIVVNDLYVTDSALYVDTTLITDKASPGDADSDKSLSANGSMYPYIVIKCEKYDLPVIFNTD